MQEPLNIALAGRYEIRGKVGAGGMATVWLAEDVKHGRRVAVKVLHPELAATLGVDRFLREIEIAGKLTHPNILTLHDSGQAEGLLFYVMPYVEGESLAERLRRETHLPVDEALEINAQVAAGLQHAHQQGVIHRDIKPDNILLSNGHAVIADFGIARAVTQAGGDKLTQTGLAVGTPAYMSPEQASATSNIDARTDLYSLACVLYEMLAGSQPFTASTPQALMARHVMDPVPSLRTVRSTVPPGVEAAITRALAKVPADRFATVAEFVEALTCTDVVAAAPTAAPGDNSIAVLPFANMSTDPENEYFSDGMAEEILNALTRVPNLRVAARTSSFTFKGKDADVGEIGRQLNVAKVLEGSVRRAGNRLRVTAQLINTGDGYHIWSEKYDRELTDVFAIQDELTEAIVQALRIKLAPGEESQLVKRGTENLEAYQLYLRGRHFWHQRGPGLQSALKYFGAAIKHDPEYALAYAGMADVFCILGNYGFMPSLVAMNKATEAADRAAAIDDSLPETHFSVGITQTYFGWNFRLAETEFRRAIALNPRSGEAHAWLAWLLALFRRFEESKAACVKAQEVEPISSTVAAVAALSYGIAGRFEDAIAAAEGILEIEPNAVTVLWVLGAARSLASFHEEGIARLEQAAALSQRSPFILMWLGTAYARAGRRDEAVKVVEELAQRPAEAHVPPVSMAQIHAYLDQPDQAFDLLRKGLDERNPSAAFLAFGPDLPGMRDDPRWMELFESAGLGEIAGLWMVNPSE